MAIVGIDLGTTSSAVAISDGNSPRLIPDSFGRTILPSLVVIRKDRQFFVGHEAVVEARKYSGENLTIGSLKRMMDRQKEFHWGEVRTSPQILTALILAELKVQAEMFLREEVTQAVIAVPANFGFYQRQFTKEAARIAGLEALRIVNEATAAVCTLTSNSERLVTAADLGGGTFDVSVIEFGDGVYEVKAAGGDDRLGGDDFTDALTKIILSKAAKDFEKDFIQSDPLTMRRIKDVAEESKLLLSGCESVEVSVPYVKSHHGKLQNIVCTVSRAEFEGECAPLLSRVERIAENVLGEAGFTSHTMNMWLLGNASRMPAIIRRLQTKFPVKSPRLSDLKTSVALGAAKVAATLKGLDRHLLLLDVTPRSLGVPTCDEHFEPLILKNATIPTRTTKIFTTVSDNQTTINIPVLEEAERESDSHRVIGMLKMENVPASRAGAQKVEVAFDVDSNNILHVSAEVKDDPHAPSAVKVTCNDFELPEKTLNQYNHLVHGWIEERRKRWPRCSV